MGVGKRSIAMPTEFNEVGTILAWTRVLDEMQQKIGDAIAADPETSTPAFPAVSEAGTAIAQIDERIANLQVSLDRAEAAAAVIDENLRVEAEHLQRYLDELREVERKLVEWASRAVS
jgi:hypothetical protein